MADKIPQFEDAQPVLQTQGVASGAEGYEAFARTLGSLANQAAEKTEQLVSEQSQSMYINSVANAEQLKTTAQIQMLEHPDQATKISRDSAYTLDTIKKSAYVNDKDRSKLDSYLSGVNDDIRLKATVTNVQQTQHEAAFIHYANWSDQLRAYKEALLTDHTKAEQLKNAMMSSLHGLVSTGALTPIQAANGLKTMEGVVEVANDHYQMYGNPHTTAQDYHTITSHPLNAGKDQTSSPINESTSWMINYHNTDRSFQGVLSDISNGNLPNPETFDSLPKSERQHAIFAMQGKQIADGMINSGQPFNMIQHTAELLGTKGSVLNYREKAVKNALDNYITNLKNGNYLNVMQSTPAGDAIMKNFVSRDSAIRNSLAYSPDAMQKALLQNKNQLVDSAVSYGHGHHIPDEYIHPIPQADMVAVEESFKLGKDPIMALQILGQYTKGNQAYLANSMKDPNKRMVIQALSLVPNTIKPQDQLDFIAANQTGRSFLNREVDAEAKDKQLMNRIYTNLAPALKMVGYNYDAEQAQTLQNSMLTTTLKYAKYLAQKDNNIALENKEFFVTNQAWEKYVDQASKIYGGAFQQNSGSNWAVNPQQLPVPLTNHELDVLADHITAEGYKNLREGYKSYEYEQALSRNPLKMVISPTNQILAVDGNGRTYASMPFTTNIVPYAKESKLLRESEKKRLIGKAIESSAKRQLNVRLPNDANP